MGKRKKLEDALAGASAAAKAQPAKKAAKPAPDGKTKDALDDLFDSASIKGRSGARKDAQSAASEAATASGPDMEQVKKEASKFLSGSSGQRAVVDGLKVYSEKELEEEMGEGAWAAFEEAAEPDLAKGLTTKDYW